MDIPRSPEIARARRRRRILLGAGAATLLVVTGVAVARLEPAAPPVDRATVWVDEVRRGPMVRQVRGVGTLVPEETRWVPAASEGRVERLLLQPGVVVQADSVVMELSNPELEMQALDALQQQRAAEAALAELKVRLESQRLDQEAAAARVQAEYNQARLRADADAELGREGLVASLNVKLSESAARELEHRQALEQQRLAMAGEAVRAQLAVQQAQVEQRRALAQLRRDQVEALKVRAGLGGVLQQVGVEVGQRVTPGSNLARIAQPERLKAVIRVPETQARDVAIGQSATIDTRNGVVAGTVARVDPAAQNGTVTVDVALAGPLPRGARPDLTVDGTIELERLASVVHVGRPAQGQPDSTMGLFRLDADGREARLVKVRLGRASVSTIEVVEGLQPGDRVILSDTSAWDAHERIRLE